MAAARRRRQLMIPKWRRFLKVTAGLVVVVVLSLNFVGRYALPRFSANWTKGPVQVFYSSPLHLTVNEDEQLRIDVLNWSTDTLKVFMRLDHTYPHVTIKDSSILFDQDIRSKEQRGKPIEVFVPFDWGGGPSNDSLGKDLGLSIVSKMNASQTEVEIAALPIAASPIPWQRTILYALYTALLAILAWAGKTLRDGWIAGWAKSLTTG